MIQLLNNKRKEDNYRQALKMVISRKMQILQQNTTRTTNNMRTREDEQYKKEPDQKESYA
jgi:hypothetical protein